MQEINAHRVNTEPLDYAAVSGWNELEYSSPPDLELLSKSILEEYAATEIDTRRDVVEQAERTVTMVRAFAGSRVPDLALVAARFQIIFDRFLNIESTDCTEKTAVLCKDLLKKFIEESQMGHEEARYFCAMGYDMVKAERGSGKHRDYVATRVKIDESNQAVGPDIAEMVSSEYSGAIHPEVWRMTEPYLDFNHMFNILKDTNIEAFIIKACELIVNLRNPSSPRESALLQDVLSAESFHAPILEVLKFDGNASTLRGDAHRIRFKKQGLGGLIEHADQRVEEIASLGMDNVLSTVFGAPHILAVPAVGTDESTGKVPIHLGDFTMADYEGGVINGHYRLKDGGSLANKIDGYGGDEPMDVMAATVVSVDESSSAREFASFVKQQLGRFEFKAARSKEKAIFAQGTAEYINHLKGQLVSHDIDLGMCEFYIDDSKDIQARGYEKLKVAKATFFAEIDGITVPTEVQFVTERERSRMRRGEIAHIIYKYIRQIARNRDCSRLPVKEERALVASATRVIAIMCERSDHLDPTSLGINERSVDRAEEVYFAIVN